MDSSPSFSGRSSSLLPRARAPSLAMGSLAPPRTSPWTTLRSPGSSARRTTATSTSSRVSSPDLLKFCLRAGLILEDLFLVAMWFSAWLICAELAKWLEKAGKGVEEAVVRIKAPWHKGHGPLHLAAAAGKVEMCKFLNKDLKLDVDTTGAVDTYEIAELLLSRGAHVDPVWEKRTPLYIAAERGNAKMMELLLQHQADPKGADPVHAPLKAAVFAHSLKGMELLIQAGANVNTGLIAAATAGLTDCINCLLNAGADADITDDNGRMLIEIAAIQGWQECVEILFPVTTPLAGIADWSIDGVIQIAKFANSKQQDHLLHEDDESDFEAEADEAFYKRDYAHAITLYIMAMEIDPGDSTLYAKRSLCFLHTGHKDKALEDANTYKDMQPDLSKSFYAQAAALVLVKEFGRACEALMPFLYLD